MSILLVKGNKVVTYSMRKPLEKQICGCSEIRIRQGMSDPTVEHFFDEVERMCQAGNQFNVAIKMMADCQIALSVNDIINKTMNMYAEADKRMKEISALMLGKKD